MKNKWLEFEEKFLKLPVIRNLVAWSQRTSLPGFEGISIYVIIRFILQEIKNDSITTRANSIAFSFMLSIFPATIFVFTLLPHLPISADYASMINDSFLKLLPKTAHEYLYNIILDITSIERKGLLSLGFFLALFFSSNGMLSLMQGFDKSYKLTFKKRGYLKKQGTAVVLTILMGFLLIVSVILIVLGNIIFYYIDARLNIPFSIEIVINLTRWLIAIILLYAGISFIYRYGPSLRKRMPLFNLGSALAATLSIISSIGFAYFVNNFGKYNELYGSIGALIVMMIWLQINSLILLIGFELNTAIAVNRDLLKQDLE